MAETGSDFKAGLQRALGGRDIDEFLDSTIFGNLKRVVPKVLAKRREALSTAFGKIVADITWILRDGTDPRNHDLPTYKAEKEKAAVLTQWREMLQMHPHRWPASPLVEYLIDISVIMQEVNKASGNAISLSDESRFAESNVTIFLPMKHEFLDIDRSKAYPYIKSLSTIAPDTVQLICSPTYEWKIDISKNITNHLAANQFSPPGFAEFLRTWAYKQIRRSYLLKLGLTEDRMDLSRLVISMGQEGTEELGRSMMAELLARPDTVKKTFGGGAYADLRQMMGSLSESSKAPNP